MAAETPFGCRLELQLERTDNLFLTECPSWFILGLSSPKSHAFRGMAFFVEARDSTIPTLSHQLEHFVDCLLHPDEQGS